MSDTCLPENRMPAVRVPAMPADTNSGGSVFGGWIMSYVDVAGSVPALERAQGPVVTRAVKSLEFKKPVFAGDMVSFYAKLIDESASSITVEVEVYAERRQGEKKECIKVSDAVLVYVAIDENRQPRALPEK